MTVCVNNRSQNYIIFIINHTDTKLQDDIKNVVSKACFDSKLAKTKVTNQEYRQLFFLEERKKMARISNNDDVKEYLIKKAEKCNSTQLKVLHQICMECLRLNEESDMDAPKHESSIDEEHPGNSLEEAEKILFNTKIESGPQEGAEIELSLTNPQQNDGIKSPLPEVAKIEMSHGQVIQPQEKKSPIEHQENGLPTTFEIESSLSKIVKYQENTKNGLSQTESTEPQATTGQSEGKSQKRVEVIDPQKEARNASYAGETPELQQMAETTKPQEMAEIVQCQEESDAIHEKMALCAPQMSMPPTSAKAELVIGQLMLFRPTGVNQLVTGFS